MHPPDILSTNLSPVLRHRSPLSVGSLSMDNFICSTLQTGILRKLLWVLDGLKKACYRLYFVNVARYIYENLLQKVKNTKLSADIHVSPYI
jgi:hypothetical protein